ncbi:MAG: nitroimidazol reductase NimA-like FMN-containing flavoprotein [Ilumatobacter sp.]|jgi:nitroimidazol reductase NimA-like FMN-containing flavoprotein (pyridoxamine 5'-phosphate oxidase superfamily)
MADTDMTHAEREAFLADIHVGVLSIARQGKGPLALPIWYLYADGKVLISMSGSSVKADLLRKRQRATLTVQQEAPPYRYVMVEGPVTLAPNDPDTKEIDTKELATRYLGAEMGAWYAKNNPPTEDSVVAHLAPEQWLTVDYSKVM